MTRLFTKLFSRCPHCQRLLRRRRILRACYGCHRAYVAGINHETEAARGRYEHAWDLYCLLMRRRALELAHGDAPPCNACGRPTYLADTAPADSETMLAVYRCAQGHGSWQRVPLLDGAASLADASPVSALLATAERGAVA